MGRVLDFSDFFVYDVFETCIFSRFECQELILRGK